MDTMLLRKLKWRRSFESIVYSAHSLDGVEAKLTDKQTEQLSCALLVSMKTAEY